MSINLRVEIKQALKRHPNCASNFLQGPNLRIHRTALDFADSTSRETRFEAQAVLGIGLRATDLGYIGTKLLKKCIFLHPYKSERSVETNASYRKVKFRKGCSDILRVLGQVSDKGTILNGH